MSSKAVRGGKQIDVNERKLKPLYDSLDNNANKKTLQEADKLLRKSPNLHCAKALKALALLRLSRTKEAKIVIAELEKIDDPDNNTIYALNVFFKEKHDYQALVRLHEKVSSKNAGEEQLTHLFMAYFCVKDYTNLQKIAIKLHKLVPENKNYIHWNISSYLLQSIKDPETGERLYLKMAETWAEKCIKKNYMNTMAEVVLYTRVLEKRKKFKEAYEVLMSPLADVMKKEDGLYYEQVCRSYLLKLQMWSQANVELKEFLIENPDDFLVFQQYIQAAHNLWPPCTNKQEALQVLNQVSEVIQNVLNAPLGMDIKENGDDKKENGDDKKEGVKTEIDSSWISVATFISARINENQSRSLTLRGPHLALMELVLCMKNILTTNPYNQLHTDGGNNTSGNGGSSCNCGCGSCAESMVTGGLDIDDYKGNLCGYTQKVWQQVMAPTLVKLVVKYSSIFGGKPCCLSDLRYFINHLSSKSQTQLLSLLTETLGFSEDSYADNILLINDEKSMWKHLFFTMLTHFCRDANDKIRHADDKVNKDDVEFLMLSGSDLSQYLKHGLQFGQHLNATESQPAEGYALLQAQLLLNLHQQTGHVLPLLKATAVLEEALESSPCSYPLKINLIRLSSMLGNTGECERLFRSMDIKYIQFDSIGYLLSNTLLFNGDAYLAATFHNASLAFFHTTPHDLINYSVITFKSNNFHKTQELIDFHDRLECSLQFLSSSISSELLSILSDVHQYDLLVTKVQSSDHVVTNLATSAVYNNRDFNVAISCLFIGNRKDYDGEVKTENLYWLLIESRILAYLVSIFKQVDQSTDQPSGSSTHHSTIQPNPMSTNQSIDQPSQKSDDTANVPKPHVTKDFDLKCSLLFNTQDPLKDFNLIASSACSFLDERKFIPLFPSSLHSFLHHNFHSSLLQFSSFHQSILSLSLNPSTDSSMTKTCYKNLQIYKLSQKIATSHAWFLKEIEMSRFCYLLLQHLGILLCVLHCCKQLMTPFKPKKGKKKNTTPTIPNALVSFDVHVYAVTMAHAALVRYFDYDPVYEHQLAKQTYIKDSRSDALVEKILTNHLKLRSNARDLLNKWLLMLQSIINKDFKPKLH